MVARDGIEPPTPAFSGSVPMDLSGLESVNTIERKEVKVILIRIVWDDLGWFPP